jgi:cytochrome c biogenesis protein CcdA/glutaredoxin-related protein
MKKYLLILLVIFIFPVIAFAQQTEKKKAVYFYSETCPHCVRVDQYFKDNGIYEKYDIKRVDAVDQENVVLLNGMYDAFGVADKDKKIPVIFFSNKLLVGDEPTIKSFVSQIEESDASYFPTIETIQKGLAAKDESMKEAEAAATTSINSMHLFLLISAAFVDAMNPCALAVLILLLATVIAAKGKKSALLAGLLFSLAIFISYFLMGYGAYKAISSYSLPKYISLGVGIFSVLVGLANLKDVFWFGKFFVMEVPMSWRPRMQKMLRSVSSPLGAFGVGFLVSLFLVPCASGPYLSILGLMATKGYTTGTMSLLVLYNLVFVSPMLIITFGMYFFDTRMGKLESLRTKYNWLLHLIAGGVMLFIGAYLIYGWLK